MSYEKFELDKNYRFFIRDLKEVNRRILLSFVTFPKFSERYFVN